jgi:cytoskeletal protein CcmA (bactofilin family)
MKLRKLVSVLGLTALILILVVPTVLAFEGRGGETVVIGEDEVIEDDLFVTAQDVIIEGTVEGDLFAMGQTIRVNGEVTGDLFAAGQEVIISGSVEDAYVTGYAITVIGSVEEDLLGGGYSLEHKPGAEIGRDLLFGGFQLLLDGDVDGMARIGANSVRLAGAIGDDVRIDVGGADQGETPPAFSSFMPMVPTVPTIPAGLTIMESASIDGNLDYVANAPVDVPGGTVEGETDFTEHIPETREDRERPGLDRQTPAWLALKWVFKQLRRLVTLLLLGILMMWLVPQWTRTLSATLESKPAPSLGLGVVAVAAFVAGFIALILIVGAVTAIFGVITLGELARRFVVLGGLVTGAVGFSFGLLWRYVTTLVVSLLLGQLIFRLFKSDLAENRWAPMIVGVIAFVLLWSIPILGWLVRLVTILVGLGAIWLWAQEALQEDRAQPTPVESPAEV